MAEPEQPLWVEVHRNPSRRSARERALVLEAGGIPYAEGAEGGEHVILVAAWDAARAVAELRAYERENPAGGAAAAVDEERVHRHGAGAAAAYAVIICSVWLAQDLHPFGSDWEQAGVAAAARIREGEVWRVVTALTLHADPVHLASNTVFGAAFVAAACQALGNGVGLLAILLSGVLGNALNAWVQAQSHASLGASTAMFGAIGLLVVVLWRRRRALSRGRVHRWIPLVAGLALLGYLGTSGENTDVMAHVLGFLAGAVEALALAAVPAERLRSARIQGASAVTAALLLVLAWFVALRA